MGKKIRWVKRPKSEWMVGPDPWNHYTCCTCRYPVPDGHYPPTILARLIVRGRRLNRRNKTEFWQEPNLLSWIRGIKREKTGVEGKKNTGPKRWVEGVKVGVRRMSVLRPVGDRHVDRTSGESTLDLVTGGSTERPSRTQDLVGDGSIRHEINGYRQSSFDY